MNSLQLVHFVVLRSITSGKKTNVQYESGQFLKASLQVEGSLKWYRNVDEHKKRYLLESTRERMTRDAMNAFENQQNAEFRDE